MALRLEQPPASECDAFSAPISAPGAIFGTPPDYTEFESDGTMQAYGNATCWDDDKYQAFGQRLTVVAGRIDYNFVDVGVDFQVNARYPQEPLCFACQFPHRREAGSDFHVHLHWAQAEANVPNWLLQYRMYDNGEAVPGVWTLAAYNNNIFAYPGAGTILQIAEFPIIDGSGLTGVSAFLDAKIYRDSTNASGLFAGADPYTARVLLKEMDIHFVADMLGSRTEYVK